LQDDEVDAKKLKSAKNGSAAVDDESNGAEENGEEEEDLDEVPGSFNLGPKSFRDIFCRFGPERFRKSCRPFWADKKNCKNI
jgi:hypothetical protein